LTIASDAAERLSNLGGVEIAFEYTDDNDEEDDDDDDDEDDDEEQDDGEEEEGEQDETENPRRPVYITRDQIMQLLGHAGLGRIFASDFTPRGGLRRRRLAEDEEEEEAYSAGTGYDPVGPRSSRGRGPRGRDLFEKVPSEQGKELMQTGNFGSNPRTEDTVKRKKRLAYDIMRRELGVGGDGRQKNATRLLKQDMIPESVADTIIHYNARCYSGQFSDDGNFFFSCAQDFRVRMYDTSNPYDWKYYKVRSNDHDLTCIADFL
jgi:WD repeat-containing protein 23